VDLPFVGHAAKRADAFPDLQATGGVIEAQRYARPLAVLVA
jgi:hypothetical protein